GFNTHDDSALPQQPFEDELVLLAFIADIEYAVADHQAPLEIARQITGQRVQGLLRKYRNTQIFLLLYRRHNLPGPDAIIAIDQQRAAFRAPGSGDQALGVRLTDVNPVLDSIIQAFLPQRGLVRI